MNEPKVHVGILFEPEIRFSFPVPYQVNGIDIIGIQTASYDNGKILWQGSLYDELLFEPADEAASEFELKDVTIGINFHWERKEDQRFLGALKIIVEDEKLTGINIIGVEDYLTSVISSEMSATASLELLKAHAVISRSWLLKSLTPNPSPKERGEDSSVDVSPSIEAMPQGSPSLSERGWGEALIRWYDRSSHLHFDVCADDHCQRYQGVTRASTEVVRQAIATTRGQILMYEDQICDARFSKCCGGAFEEFQYCWEDVKYPYLSKQRDSKFATNLPDLRTEAEAEKWIRTAPEAFCNTTDKHILSQVLNNYDQETIDFYRWKVEYTGQELSELIFRRSGIDFGTILDMIPIERGTSARLTKLKIIGSKRTLIIGKELEIRRTLSPSHLYSSAFVIDKVGVKDGIPARFILIGAGWGHGVGLCQIGAAVMGEQGYAYDDILLHYYTGAAIDKLYD
ncbi:Amidase enhancer [termite gut metagenome]|uniref:Amidase enhancer n=1 Tax=termite gut metagenome TaxID=433724 RepID=A0A5J4QPP9_9ZZZZ